MEHIQIIMVINMLKMKILNLFDMKAKYFLLFFVFCLAGISFNSCKDDKEIYNNVSEREFMTQFRHYDNFRNDGRLSPADQINRASESPPYGCGNLFNEGKPNSLYLIWYGVEGCLGYHVRIKSSLTGVGEGQNRWSPEAAILDTIIYDPAQITLVVENLQYGFLHDCAIRVLSKKGLAPSKNVFYTPAYENDPYHSYWYGYGGGQHRPNYCRVYTAPRFGVPTTVVRYGERGEDGTWVDVVVNLNAKAWLPGGAANPNGDNLNPLIEIEEETSLFKATYVILEPQVMGDNRPETKTKYFGTDIIVNNNPSDETNYGIATVRFDGLTKNVMYMINVVNDNPEMIKWDRLYNTAMVRMKGDPLPPMTIEHQLYTAQPNTEGVITADEVALEALSKKHNACRIDQVLNSYMDDNNYPEDSEFQLEPGKTYFINSGIEISKGLRLRCDDPNNRATVLMGIGFITTGNAIMVDYDKNRLNGQGVRASNFSFGRNPRAGEMGSINISEIVFENIDFQVTNGYNFDNIDYVPGASTGLPNYFINQSASAMNFSCDKFEVRNCDFQGFHRGFIRTQGGNAQRFKEFTLDGILVYNCGAYDDAGRGYSVIAGANNNANACLFANMTIKNSSFVNSPYHALFSETGDNVWPEGDVWNVTLENNTFLNFSTRSESNNQRVLFELLYPPPHSKFTIKNNLFIICPAKGETPDNYHSAGIRILRHPEGFKWDIANNYSTNVFPGASTSIFRHRAFNSTTESAGIDGGSYNIGGLSALEILLGSPSLAPEELMKDPYPLGFLRTKLGHKHNIEGLYYQNTDKVRNHPIVINKIGDPRWSKNL